jgi:hypothetical protein
MPSGPSTRILPHIGFVRDIELSFQGGSQPAGAETGAD